MKAFLVYLIKDDTSSERVTNCENIVEDHVENYETNADGRLDEPIHVIEVFKSIVQLKIKIDNEN